MSRRRKIIAGNWKLNPAHREEALRIFKTIKKITAKTARVLTVVCPPAVYLSECRRFVAEDSLVLGGQDAYPEYSGAYTGEINALMLASAGASYTLAGHSERRATGETDELVARKVLAALKAGLTVILCIGEKERDAQGIYLDFLKNQIRNSLFKVERRLMKNVIIAYEPVWEIGKKSAMAPSDIYEMTIFIKKILSDIYGQEDAMKTRVLYGGSVTFRNAKDVVTVGKVDGLLVGRESLNPDGFGEIIKIVDEIN